MASTTNQKLPAATSKAAIKAVEEEVDAKAPSAGDGATFFKALTILLIVLNLGAVGAYVALKFFLNSDMEKSIKTNGAMLATLKSELVNLDAAVRRIKQERIQQVSDPGTLVISIAANHGFDKHLSAGQKVVSRLGRSNYEETTVKFQFYDRQSYEYLNSSGGGGMLAFFDAIENANPTLQVKDIDFASRSTELGNENKWEMKDFSVRVLRPKAPSN